MSFADQAKSYLSHIDSSTSGLSVLKQFETQTGLPRSYAVLAGVGVYFVLIFLNVAGIGQLLSNVAGFVIPGYFSLVALETSTSKDDTQLLTYWVVFAALNVVEFWSKAILYWVPFYYLFKTIFLLYIGIPSFGGASMIYHSLIKPISQKYISSGVAKDIDQTAEGFSSSVEL